MARQGGASGEEAPPQEQSFFEFLARMCKNEPRKEKVTFVAGKGATGKILGIPEPIASKVLTPKREPGKGDRGTRQGRGAKDQGHAPRCHPAPRAPPRPLLPVNAWLRRQQAAH
jgi:hypothetical protein